jgi:predicted RNA-binding protein with PIN domain
MELFIEKKNIIQQWDWLRQSTENVGLKKARIRRCRKLKNDELTDLSCFAIWLRKMRRDLKRGRRR